jgi:hypothetical protein
LESRLLEAEAMNKEAKTEAANHQSVTADLAELEKLQEVCIIDINSNV